VDYSNTANSPTRPRCDARRSQRCALIPALALSQINRVIGAVRGSDADSESEPPKALNATLEFDVHAGSIAALVQTPAVLMRAIAEFERGTGAGPADPDGGSRAVDS
jgi:hypothetical protein